MDTPPQDAQPAFPPSTGLALTSLLLGIASVGLSFILFGFLFGAVGVGLGFAYLSKKRGPTGMARWGIGLSILGILASIGFAVLYVHYYRLFKTTYSNPGVPMAQTAALTNPAPLPDASPLLHSNLLWSTPISGARAMCVGDWDNDGSTLVLVAAGRTLHVLDLTGAEKSTVPLPDTFTTIECGRNKTAGARLLGYAVPMGRLTVIDHTGKVLWSESAGMGLDGAHWGDLQGDGNDDVIMGMNGFGGLKALSADGKQLWSVNMANVWSQAIIPAGANRPVLVLATDASGSVNVLDAVGKHLNTLRPEGGYFAQMTAGLVESNAVQILAFSGNSVVAFDATGKTNWIAPAQGMSGLRQPCAALGDVKGDGTQQWVFMDPSGALVIASTSGQKVSSIASQSRIQGYALAPRTGQGALLITLDSGLVRAYSFVP